MNTKSLLTRIGVPVLSLGLLGGAGTALARAARAATNQGQSGTTLSGSVTAGITQDKANTWSLAKAGSPDKASIWLGDADTIHWTVTATKHPGQLSAPRLASQATVTNGGAVATQDLLVKAWLEQKGSGSTWNTIGTPQDVTSTGLAVLAPHQSDSYEFGMDPVPGFSPAATYRVEYLITITNHSGAQVDGFNPKADAPPSVHETGSTLHVTDSNGKAWDFSDTGSQSYDQPVTGDKLGEQAYPNTASAPGTDVPDASAQVKVTVYGLGVAKAMAGTSYTRTYHWALGNPRMDDTKVHIGQDPDATYQVPVTVTAENSGWQADGTVTITNDTPLDASLASVTDSLPVQFTDPIPDALAAGHSVTLHFTYSPADGKGGTNHADVALSNGTKFGADASYDFDHAKVTEMDKNATIQNTGTITGDDTHTPGQGSDGHIQVQEP